MSLLAHAGLGGAAYYGGFGFGGGSSASTLTSRGPATPKPESRTPPAQPPTPTDPQPPEPRDTSVRIGLADSLIENNTWLGFTDPTEHSAPLSATDQSLMSPDAGGDGSEGDGNGMPLTAEVAPAPAAEPQPEPAPAAAPMPAPETTPTDAPPTDVAPPPPTPAEVPPVADAPADTPAVEAVAPPPPAVPESTPEGGEAPVPGKPLESDVKEPTPDPVPTEDTKPGQKVDPVDGGAPLAPPNDSPTNDPADRPREPAEAATPVPAPATAPNTAAPKPPAPPAAAGLGPKGRGKLGERAQREADAAALKDAINARPGRVAAGKGLEITTIRPRWSVTTKLTSTPRNPVVEVRFGRDGKVKSARFLTDQSTGYKDVDAPLLDAVYRWTAKGVPLEKLAADDPDAVVSVAIRFMLRAEKETEE